MAAGSQIGRCYKVIGALLQGRELDRRLIAKLIHVEPAAADAHIKALLEFVPNVQARRTRHHRTIRLTSDAALGPTSRRLAVATCLGASVASLFRGTNYEQLLDQARDSVIGRLRKARDFEDARRKFLFIFQAGDVALPDRQHVFDDLVDAVLEQRRVHIEYTGFEGDERSEEISPWSIAIYDHQLYVLAEGTSSAPRAYRLSRIRGVKMRTKTFKYPDRLSYDPETLFRDTFGIFIRGDGPVEDVVLRLSPRWRTYARTHRWHFSQRISEERDGTVIVRMRVRTCNELKAFILGFGSDAEVLEPVHLRSHMAEQAERLRHMYGDGGVAGSARRQQPPRSDGAAKARPNPVPSARRSAAHRQRSRDRRTGRGART